MIVVDASVLVNGLVNGSGLALPLAHRTANQWVAAPHLIDLETVNAVKQLERGSILDRDTAESIVREIFLMPLRRHDHRPLLGRCWELRHDLSIYDASYVALAEKLGVTLLTGDRSLAEVSGANCEIEFLS